MKPRILPVVTVFVSMVFLIVDFVYKTVNNISRLNRDRCLLFRLFPEPLFPFFENFVELFFIIVAGLFIGALAERVFLKSGRFMPGNPLQAFIAGSLLPVCSCGAVPLAASFGGKADMRTLVTFLVSAPLLNPWFIALSFSILGPRFALVRIAASLLLAVSAGYVLDLFARKWVRPSLEPFSCSRLGENADPFDKTWLLLKKIFPWYLAAAAAGTALSFTSLERVFDIPGIVNPVAGIVLALLAGIPLYMCNGADLLLLKPLVDHLGISLGMALTFSITSTSVCLSSIILLTRFLGMKLTAVLLIHLLVVTAALGLALSGLGL